MAQWGVIDELHYDYDDDYVANGGAGNWLIASAGATDGADFVDGASLGAEYGYDGNGNMTRDENRGVSVRYAWHNLPEAVEWDDGRRIQWVYDATGRKLTRIVSAPDGAAARTEYVGGMVYEQASETGALADA